MQTISDLLDKLRDGTATEAAFSAQVCEIMRKETAAGKPFYEVKFRDAAGNLTLRAWSDRLTFSLCEKLTAGDVLEVSGTFQSNQYGPDSKNWTARILDEYERADFFAGTAQARSETTARLEAIEKMLDTIRDPRLEGLCRAFLAEHSQRFARSAAARTNHHAWRGGLLAHTVQMLRSADALCRVYPILNRDLLLVGTFFHDSGKLWETCPPEEGFDIPRDIHGELLGHISIGIELINSLWHSLPLDQWRNMHPPSENVRMHLLHLIAAHHGQLEFGSPVLPKTPEAMALHFIDNLDARMDMFESAYRGKNDGIAYDFSRPLGVSPIEKLDKI